MASHPRRPFPASGMQRTLLGKGKWAIIRSTCQPVHSSKLTFFDVSNLFTKPSATRSIKEMESSFRNHPARDDQGAGRSGLYGALIGSMTAGRHTSLTCPSTVGVPSALPSHIIPMQPRKVHEYPSILPSVMYYYAAASAAANVHHELLRPLGSNGSARLTPASATNSAAQT